MTSGAIKYSKIVIPAEAGDLFKKGGGLPKDPGLRRDDRGLYYLAARLIYSMADKLAFTDIDIGQIEFSKPGDTGCLR